VFHFLQIMSNLLRVCWLMIASSPLWAACSLSQIAADQAGGIAAISSGYMRGFWDYEIARAGTASAIMQLEAMHSVSPQNEALALALASAYIGHAFGYVELDMEKASAEHQYAKATRLRLRAELLYRRARDLALATMRTRDPALDELLKGEPAAFADYLEREYDSADDLAPVFWTASAWGSMLGQTDALDAAVDLPMIRVMIEHVIKRDPGYESGAGLVFLGGLLAQTPPAFGGDLDKAKAYFERALALTQRRSHVVQLNYAKLYAATIGDQALFHALLNEIMAPEDQGSDVRMSNKIARMHAEVLLAKAQASKAP
jgi:hypothetical protein